MTGKITRKCMLWASCVWILIGAAVLIALGIRGLLLVIRG